MRVLILANSRSGRGRSSLLLSRFIGALDHEGIETDVLPTDACGPGVLERRLGGCDALVAIGGDGTVHHSLGALRATGVPFYHVPAGNENLLARELGSTCEPAALVAAVRGGRVRRLDLGEAGGRAFAIMLSVGPDAGVIHRLAASRGSAIGHAMYLSPISAEVRRPHVAHLTVTVDGERVVDGVAGQLVVANCRQYATRLNPALRACMDDGRLDVVFLPGRGIAGLLLWGVRCAMGAHELVPGCVTAAGCEIRIESDRPVPWQIDGEEGAWIGPGEPLDVTVRAGAVCALAPA